MIRPFTFNFAVFSIISVFISSSVYSFQQTTQNNRERTSIQTGWKFYKGAVDDGHTLGFDDSNWEIVSIPHDWAISGPFVLDGNGSTGKLPWKGEGWYRNELEIPNNYSGKRLYLIFDGVMAFPKVYLNGKLVGEWDYGYNSFYIDITEAAKPGEINLLAVHANTTNHDSRWYPGAGIYRKVQLLAVEPLHVNIWGTYVTTPIVKSHYAEVRINTNVVNATKKNSTILVEQQILAPNGNIVAQDTISNIVKAGKEGNLELTLPVNNPQRWDTDNPILYTAKTNIWVNGAIVDTYFTEFGIRTIRFDADHGMYLNDKRVQLEGVNLHHGHGPLGAAFYPRAMERQLQIMKSMGVNAVRTSHNTAAPELLELCDRMGILFFNEVFDKYDAKMGITENTDFEEFAQRNIKNHVLRDRNHASLFLWSVGNEIGDVQWNVDNGFQRLHTMLNYVNKYDPTRPTTLVNDSWEGAANRHFDLYDIHSWNYDRRYRLARQIEPNKAVIISESASTVSTRGFYEFPLPTDKTDFTSSLQISSYDLNAPYWAEIGDDDFMWQQDEEYIAGEFVWTGFDYLGEPTPYDNLTVNEMGMTDREASRSSYFGIVDIVGIPKDRYYLYKSYWKQDETTVHILPHWNWEDAEQDTLPVFVYTNGDCAELFLNDTSLGMQCKNPQSKNSVERFRLMWMGVDYEPGTIYAVAYREGEIIGHNTLKTAGKAHSVLLTADRTHIKKGGMDLSYIQIEAFDKDGNPQPLAAHRINIKVEGAGELVGVGNGNPQSFEPFQAEYVDLFYGKAMIIIKAGMEAGRVKVSVNADELRGDSINIKVE